MSDQALGFVFVLIAITIFGTGFASIPSIDFFFFVVERFVGLACKSARVSFYCLTPPRSG